MPSAGPAGEGLLAVYRGVDRLVGELAADFPDAALVVFSMGGMGANHSDTASMVLLPELMYRHAFGRPLLRQPDAWADRAAVPLLGEQQDWVAAVHANFPASTPPPARRPASRPFRAGLAKVLRRFVPQSEPVEESYLRRSAGWIPATLYQPHWRSMPAFALPSFYDGRIRINLSGRESGGMVAASEYEAKCDELEALLRACRDPATGDEVVKHVERVAGRDPLTLGPTESDMVVVWKGTFCALEHPTHGRVGPVPFRRPGGHTGPFGMAYVGNAGLEAGEWGVRSSFDVVPTLIELMGEPLPEGLSGASLLQ
jgi:hypothetical protein